MHTGNLCYSKQNYEVTNTPAKPIHAYKTMTKLQYGLTAEAMIREDFIQAIRREGKKLMQKGSQADNEGRGKARQ